MFKRMPGGSETVLTIFVYILEHRLFLFALNLVVGALFAVIIHSIPRLRRRGISYGWFRFFVREESAARLSSVGQVEAQQTYISLGTLSHFFFRSSLSSGTPSPPSSNLFLNLETINPNTTRPPDGQSITTFTSGNTNTTLSRSNSEDSRRWLGTISMTRTPRPRPLEPLRRPTVEDQGRIGTRNTSPSHITTSPPSISQTVNPELPAIDRGDLRVPETPISPASVDIPGESPALESPGRNRPPTYGTTLSHQSFMTLPVYREADDDRMSVASRAPTYKSTATACSPFHFRFTRPPLPLPPPSSYPSNMSGGNEEEGYG